jgi:hypothetical protein
MTERVIHDLDAGSTCWYWDSMLQYSFQSSGQLDVTSGSYTLPYGYEFQGLWQPVLLHPDSDRCLATMASTIACTSGMVLQGNAGACAPAFFHNWSEVAPWTPVTTPAPMLSKAYYVLCQLR